MTFSRRDILKSTGAGLSVLALPALAQPARDPGPFKLRASAFPQTIRPGARTGVWGFNGSVPGPVLRFRQGDVARIALLNDLPDKATTTVHWHGIRAAGLRPGCLRRGQPRGMDVPLPHPGACRRRDDGNGGGRVEPRPAAAEDKAGGRKAVFRRLVQLGPDAVHQRIDGLLRRFLVGQRLRNAGRPAIGTVLAVGTHRFAQRRFATCQRTGGLDPLRFDLLESAEIARIHGDK